VRDTQAEPSSGSAGPSITTLSVLLPMASYNLQSPQRENPKHESLPVQFCKERGFKVKLEKEDVKKLRRKGVLRVQRTKNSRALQGAAIVLVALCLSFFVVGVLW